MDNKFNPLDPLGVFKKAKDQVDSMAAKSGLPVLPSVPGLQQRSNAERAVVHRERFPGTSLPARGTGMPQIPDPLGLLKQVRTKVEDRGFSHDKGV